MIYACKTAKKYVISAAENARKKYLLVVGNDGKWKLQKKRRALANTVVTGMRNQSEMMGNNGKRK